MEELHMLKISKDRTDIADMTIDNNGYYQISIKDIQYTNDDSTNQSYDSIMKFAKQIVYTNVQ